MTLQQTIDILTDLNRQRVAAQKTAIMVGNRLRAQVAINLGYRGGDTAEEDRKQYMDLAQTTINAIRKGEDGNCPESLADLIVATLGSLDSFNAYDDVMDGLIAKEAKKLPVAKWVQQKEQNGFSLRYLGIVVAECGDLSNYSGPRRVWKRMACAPYTADGVTHMGSSWRMYKRDIGFTLTAPQWEEYGYSPRRRSLGFLMDDSLIRANKHALGKDQPGPYYQHYAAVKERAKLLHPDWRPCHTDRHARLLALKLFLKNLWAVWNDKPVTAEYVQSVEYQQSLVAV